MTKSSVVSPGRIVEILQQCVSDDILRMDGERIAYEDFFLDLEGEEDEDKIGIYLDNERRATRLQIDGGELSHDGWRRALGRLDAIEKIEKAIEKYGK